MQRTLLLTTLFIGSGALAQQTVHLTHLLEDAAVHQEHREAYELVLLDEEPLVPAPELVSFEASSQGSTGVQVRWTAQNEHPGDLYRVERSNDLLSWYTATEVTVGTVRDGYVVHQAVDTLPFTGVSYYRLMHVGPSGEQELSDRFSVRHDLGQELVIYEGHAPGHFVVLANGAISEMQLLNNRGQFVAMDMTIDGERVRVNAELLASGTYYVQAVVDGKRTMRPVIIANGSITGG